MGHNDGAAASVGEIRIDGQTIRYVVRRSRRAKHVRVKVTPEAVVLAVVPQQFGIRRIPGILQQNGPWLRNRIERCRRLQKAAKELETDGCIPYLGRRLQVAACSDHEEDGVAVQQDALKVHLSPGAGPLASVLERWYRTEAQKLIGKRAAGLSAQLGCAYNRLTIRGQKTRWGSCSRRGNLSFNWKLLKAPEPVIDYVIIHELLHLKEMNHSPKFWQLVARHCPRWQEHRKWLKDHEFELNARLPEGVAGSAISLYT